MHNLTRTILEKPISVTACLNVFSLSYESHLDALAFRAWYDLYSIAYQDMTWDQFIEQHSAIFRFPHLAFWLTAREAQLEIKNCIYRGLEGEGDAPRVEVILCFSENDLSAGQDLYKFRQYILKKCS